MTPVFPDEVDIPVHKTAIYEKLEDAVDQYRRDTGRLPEALLVSLAIRAQIGFINVLGVTTFTVSLLHGGEFAFVESMCP